MFSLSTSLVLIIPILASVKYSASEYRRHRASQEVDHLRQEQAAVQIQSTFRGYRDRKSIGKSTNQSSEAGRTLENDIPTPSAPPVPFEEYSPQTEELRLVESVLPRTSGTGNGEEGEEQQQQQQQHQLDAGANLKQIDSLLITSTTTTSSGTTAPTTASTTTTPTEKEPPTESFDTDEEKRTRAATCIQAHYRGHLTRKKYSVTVTIAKQDTECEDTEQVIESDNKLTVEVIETELRPGSQNSTEELLDESRNVDEPTEPVIQTPSESEPEDQKVSSETIQSGISDTVVEGTNSGKRKNSEESESQNFEESRVVVDSESAEPVPQPPASHDLENTSSSQETQQLPESSDVTEQESDKEKEKTAQIESSTPE